MTLIIVSCVTIACLPVNPATVACGASNSYAMFVHTADRSDTLSQPPGEGYTPNSSAATGLELTA